MGRRLSGKTALNAMGRHLNFTYLSFYVLFLTYFKSQSVVTVIIDFKSDLIKITTIERESCRVVFSLTSPEVDCESRLIGKINNSSIDLLNAIYVIENVSAMKSSRVTPRNRRCQNQVGSIWDLHFASPKDIQLPYNHLHLCFLR